MYNDSQHYGINRRRWPLQRFVTNDIYENAQTKDDANYYPLYSGQGLRMLKRNQSAEEVVNEIIIQAKERLSILERQMEKQIHIVNECQK